MRTLISILALAVICASVAYAAQREQFRRIDLHELYGQINSQSFNGQLPDVDIKFSDLTAERGVTRWMEDGSFIIDVDRASNPNERELRDTVQHEACHIATLPNIEPGADHGPAFQNCMARFTLNGRSVNY